MSFLRWWTGVEGHFLLQWVGSILWCWGIFALLGRLVGYWDFLFFSLLSAWFFGGLGVLDHGAVFDVCTLFLLHAPFHGLDIPDTVHSFVMGLYIAAR